MATKPAPPHTRIIAAVAAVLLAGVALAGCSGKDPEHTMTARDGRDRVVELVINTTTQLDITGWWPRNGVAWAQDCGESGASYGYDQWAPQGTDHIGDAKRVAEYWESLGMTVRTVNPTTHPTLFAEGGPVLRASFDTDAAEGSYAIGATARCSPGEDAWELNTQDEAERACGTVLPGDEGIIITPDPRDQWTTETPTPPECPQ
ncbi:hypothetical protein GCM10022198_25660 [Klugiella xanthotipulae]|uniref:Uncharacterized protein n=1 Tax=Klugiella xanthotipulae TaxID=244735 RepID=A0A543I609_9MICO|nr:hypothetical protein [Klugiella xanthotipulae]TQM65900.1 hypothetical protein FB466_0720 [Klugiella xanthotipulae]